MDADFFLDEPYVAIDPISGQSMSCEGYISKPHLVRRLAETNARETGNGLLYRNLQGYWVFAPYRSGWQPSDERRSPV